MDKSIQANKWHSLSVNETLNILQSSKSGLTLDDVLERRELFGLNKLSEQKRKNKFIIFFEQFNDILIFILIAGALISVLLAITEVQNHADLTAEHFLDAIVITIVLLFNALIGFYQEIKAEKEVASLKSLVTTESIVIRNGKITKVLQDQLVIGDIIELEAGQKVPADARIIEANNLQMIESSLTGESIPVEKSSKVLTQDISLADRSNMLFMGTTASYGKGLAVITSIGNETEVGKIANMMTAIESSQTPLQRRLEVFGKQLGLGTLLIAFIMIIFGFLSEYFSAGGNIDLIKTFLDLTIIGVSLVIAAVPEGLPAVMVLVLALGIRRMAKQNTISKSLQAIESIGSATFICTDKTGTLTLNKMVVNKFVTTQKIFLTQDIKEIDHSSCLFKLIQIGERANSASLTEENYNSENDFIGDPLDIAILETVFDFSSKGIYSYKSNSKFSELPFDSERKRMSTIAKSDDEKYILYTKGAPDNLLEITTHFISEDGSEIQLSESKKEELLKKINDLSSEGLKVIGCGYRTLDQQEAVSSLKEKFNFDDIERDLIFTGFICLSDPPRPEVVDSIHSCKNAGIDVMMITGDHPNTALAIGKQINLVDNNETSFLTGSEIEKMDQTQLEDRLDNTRILARVSPEHKLRVVKILQNKGHIVAMTGDGVNDAPALRQADIGVAMGKSGTEAATEASDLILTDDNFATLVDAIEEGRSIQTNIRKFIGYLLASNAGEVLLLLLTVLIVGYFAPSLIVELSPLNESQILYMNLVTDTFLAIAIGLEGKNKSVMKQPPLNPNEPIITKKTFYSIIYTGSYVSIITLASFIFLLGNPSDWHKLTTDQIAYAQTMTMTLIIFMETFIALSYRSNESILSINIFSNRVFVLSFLMVYIFHLMIIYIPFLRLLFSLTQISLIDLLLVILFSMIALLLEEIKKKFLFNLENENYQIIN